MYTIVASVHSWSCR